MSIRLQIDTPCDDTIEAIKEVDGVESVEVSGRLTYVIGSFNVDAVKAISKGEDPPEEPDVDVDDDDDDDEGDDE